MALNATNGKNRRGVNVVLQRQGNQRRHDEHHPHDRRELLPKNLPEAFPPAVRLTHSSRCCLRPQRHFRLTETAIGVCPELV